MHMLRVPEQESPIMKKSRKKHSRLKKGSVAKKAVGKKRPIFGSKDAAAAGKTSNGTSSNETPDKPADQPHEKNTEVCGQPLGCWML